MQWERSRGVAGRAKTAAASHQVTDWTNSILRSNNIALVALGERTVALVMLFCVQYHISNPKKCPIFLLHACWTIAALWLCLSGETVQTYLLCPRCKNYIKFTVMSLTQSQLALELTWTKIQVQAKISTQVWQATMIFFYQFLSRHFLSSCKRRLPSPESIIGKCHTYTFSSKDGSSVKYGWKQFEKQHKKSLILSFTCVNMLLAFLQVEESFLT